MFLKSVSIAQACLQCPAGRDGRDGRDGTPGRDGPQVTHVGLVRCGSYYRTMTKNLFVHMLNRGQFVTLVEKEI